MPAVAGRGDPSRPAQTLRQHGWGRRRGGQGAVPQQHPAVLHSRRRSGRTDHGELARRQASGEHAARAGLRRVRDVEDMTALTAGHHELFPVRAVVHIVDLAGDTFHGASLRGFARIGHGPQLCAELPCHGQGVAVRRECQPADAAESGIGGGAGPGPQQHFGHRGAVNGIRFDVVGSQRQPQRRQRVVDTDLPGRVAQPLRQRGVAAVGGGLCHRLLDRSRYGRVAGLGRADDADECQNQHTHHDQAPHVPSARARCVLATTGGPRVGQPRPQAGGGCGSGVAGSSQFDSRLVWCPAAWAAPPPGHGLDSVRWDRLANPLSRLRQGTSRRAWRGLPDLRPAMPLPLHHCYGRHRLLARTYPHDDRLRLNLSIGRYPPRPSPRVVVPFDSTPPLCQPAGGDFRPRPRWCKGSSSQAPRSPTTPSAHCRTVCY